MVRSGPDSGRKPLFGRKKEVDIVRTEIERLKDLDDISQSGPARIIFVEGLNVTHVVNRVLRQMIGELMLHCTPISLVSVNVVDGLGQILPCHIVFIIS